MALDKVTPIAPTNVLNADQRVEMFLQVLEDASEKFGVRLGISDVITNLPNGAFNYTPPTIIPMLVKDWTPKE